MNTWLEIAKDGAEAYVGLTATDPNETLRTLLIYATEAQNKLQDRSFSVRREWEFVVEDLSEEGSIPEDTELGVIYLVELIPPTGRRSASEIYPLPFMSFRGRQRSVEGSGDELVYMRHNRHLHIDPLPQTSGTICVSHAPKLLSYSVRQGQGATGRYANFEDDIERAMEENGPEPEFEKFSENISQYVAYRTIESRPDLLQLHKVKYRQLREEWQQALNAAVIDDVPVDYRTRRKGWSLGGV